MVVKHHSLTVLSKSGLMGYFLNQFNLIIIYNYLYFVSIIFYYYFPLLLFIYFIVVIKSPYYLTINFYYYDILANNNLCIIVKGGFNLIFFFQFFFLFGFFVSFFFFLLQPYVWLFSLTQKQRPVLGFFVQQTNFRSIAKAFHSECVLRCIEYKCKHICWSNNQVALEMI